MNSVLFAKMDQIFNYKNKTLKNTEEMGKNTGKVGEFCQSGKKTTENHALKFQQRNDKC